MQNPIKVEFDRRRKWTSGDKIENRRRRSQGGKLAGQDPTGIDKL